MSPLLMLQTLLPHVVALLLLRFPLMLPTAGTDATATKAGTLSDAAGVGDHDADIAADDTDATTSFRICHTISVPYRLAPQCPEQFFHATSKHAATKNMLPLSRFDVQSTSNNPPTPWGL